VDFVTAKVGILFFTVGTGAGRRLLVLKHCAPLSFTAEWFSFGRENVAGM
jgi:hypothetical protein